MPQQYRQYMFIRSRFSLCILQKFMFCCELAFPITPYARLLQQCLLLWVRTISMMGTKLKKPFWPTFWWLHSSITPWPIHLLLQLWLLQMVFILLWLGYNYCSGWLLTRRFATRILLLKPSAWTPNATVVHGTHESYKFMISSSGVISMFDFSHISSQLAQPERLAPQFVLTTIIKLKFGKKRKTQCEVRCLDTFVSEILNLKNQNWYWRIWCIIS